jgi:hypothetical protein
MDQLSDLDCASPDLETTAAAILAKEWAAVQDGSVEVPRNIPEAVRDAISRSIESKTKTYRYVLPTQLLSKVANPSLDCRAVQANAALPGAFDARSIAQHVIVPFERNTENVLGGAPEPYANNPMRIPAILPDERPAQQGRIIWHPPLITAREAGIRGCGQP